MDAAAALRFRVVRAVQFDNVAVCVFNDFFAFNDVCIFQANFFARCETEEFLHWFFHEVILFDVNGLAEGHFARAHGFVFLVVVGNARFGLAVWVVRNDYFQWVNDGHQARCF